MNRGTGSLYDDQNRLRDSSQRAQLFSEFLKDKIWGLSANGVQREEDLSEFISQEEKEEVACLSSPFRESEVRGIRSELPNKKSSLPTYVAYES